MTQVAHVDPTVRPAPLMSPTGWGDPTRRAGLPAHGRDWLQDRLGEVGATPATPASPVPSRAGEDLLAALRQALSPDAVLTDDVSRLERAAGRSYLDLLALRGGGPVPAPDVVVLASAAEDVAAVLQICRRQAVAVVPFGGGTSVVGGVQPRAHRPQGCVVSLDLRRMDRLLQVDAESLTATFEPGVRGPAAEALLAPHGLTLGHFPQSFEYASLGGFAVTRSAGQASTGHGRFEDLVLALTVQTPAGELSVGRGAASAAGPDLLALLAGSEGTLGVVTSMTLRVRRLPDHERYEGLLFRSFDQGCAALREMEQQGVAPVVARLSDVQETQVQVALAGRRGVRGRAERGYLRLRGYGEGALAVLGWEGTASSTEAARAASLAVARRHGALQVGESVGKAWQHGRFDGPYLRDDLLDAGYLIETLETSATWSRLHRTHQAVRAALASALTDGGRAPVVMCHVSHLYPHGASLYFTVLARRSAHDACGQWTSAKRAASEAIVEAGATITHHHAVGLDHVPWMQAEVGPLGLQVLAAVKSVLDPTGILNPGKLLPAGPGPGGNTGPVSAGAEQP